MVGPVWSGAVRCGRSGADRCGRVWCLWGRCARERSRWEATSHAQARRGPAMADRARASGRGGRPDHGIGAAARAAIHVVDERARPRRETPVSLAGYPPGGRTGQGRGVGRRSMHPEHHGRSRWVRSSTTCMDAGIIKQVHDPAAMLCQVIRGMDGPTCRQGRLGFCGPARGDAACGAGTRRAEGSPRGQRSGAQRWRACIASEARRTTTTRGQDEARAREGGAGTEGAARSPRQGGRRGLRGEEECDRRARPPRGPAAPIG